MPMGRGVLHVSYASCLRENIGKTMIATLGLFLPYEMSHLHLMSTLEELHGGIDWETLGL